MTLHRTNASVRRKYLTNTLITSAECKIRQWINHYPHTSCSSSYAVFLLLPLHIFCSSSCAVSLLLPLPPHIALISSSWVSLPHPHKYDSFSLVSRLLPLHNHGSVSSVSPPHAGFALYVCQHGYFDAYDHDPTSSYYLTFCGAGNRKLPQE